MLAYQLAIQNPSRDDPNWPLPSFDAKDWAEAFCKIAKTHGHDIDEEWMVTWFANALMRGYDEHLCVRFSLDPDEHLKSARYNPSINYRSDVLSEMVERVARAMFDVGHADAHGPDIYEEQASWWRECARAAIEAMREPSKAMLAAGGTETGGDIGAVGIAKIWRAMIDTALK